MKIFSGFGRVFAIVLFASSSIAAESMPPGQVVMAIFAGGCFWCVEADFDKVPGVIATESGDAGGKLDNPTYEQVSAGRHVLSRRGISPGLLQEKSDPV